VAVKIGKGNAEDGGFTFLEKIHITRRELEVLSLAANGFENEEVAKKLKVGVQTVRNHQYNVMKKLGARNRAHAVAIAIQKGMLLWDRDRAFGKPKGGYMWCLHCERTYEHGQFRVERVKPFTVDHVRYAPVFDMCPYEGCTGDAVLDAWEWEFVREYHPEYPEVPEAGKVYALYPLPESDLRVESASVGQVRGRQHRADGVNK
jgi:DNA-binding CsgD family transcriptional regulator